MTKKDFEKMNDLIIDLELALEHETDDSMVYDDCYDWFDLLQHCDRSRKIYDELQDYLIAYDHTPRDLTKLENHYENQIKQYHETASNEN